MNGDPANGKRWVSGDGTSAITLQSVDGEWRLGIEHRDEETYPWAGADGAWITLTDSALKALLEGVDRFVGAR